MNRCPTCGRARTRSSEQNRRYWSLINEIAEKVLPDGIQYSAKTWHEYFKLKYLGTIEIKLPNGKTVETTASSAGLETADFTDYMTRVEEWASTRNVFLPE